MFVFSFSQSATICIGALSLRKASEGTVEAKRNAWQRSRQGRHQLPSKIFHFSQFMSSIVLFHIPYTSMYFHLISQYVSLSKLASNPLSRIFPHGLGIHFGHFLLHTSIARASHRQQDLVSVLKRTSSTSTRNLEILQFHRKLQTLDLQFQQTHITCVVMPGALGTTKAGKRWTDTLLTSWSIQNLCFSRIA